MFGLAVYRDRIQCQYSIVVDNTPTTRTQEDQWKRQVSSQSSLFFFRSTNCFCSEGRNPRETHGVVAPKRSASGIRSCFRRMRTLQRLPNHDPSDRESMNLLMGLQSQIGNPSTSTVKSDLNADEIGIFGSSLHDSGEASMKTKSVSLRNQESFGFDTCYRRRYLSSRHGSTRSHNGRVWEAGLLVGLSVQCAV